MFASLSELSRRQSRALSALDASFLGLEDESYHMHVGSVMIFDVGPLRTSSGGVDIERIRNTIEAHLHWVPHLRQRLAYIPYERMPVWVDDERFRLAYHVRHTALPQPGDERMLKRLVGRIMSQPFDRKRPLWEMWVVEGLAGDRFALISKTHHCMIDGISGADVMSVILEPYPNAEAPPPRPWKPRPCPSNARLVFEEIRRRAAQPPEALQAVYDALRHPEETLRELTETAAAIVQTVAPALSPVSQTPINVDVGPHRRFDWTDMQLADLKTVKNVLGGTINDVVLATVAGALRVFFTQRGVDPDELEIRGLVPVSVRTQDQRGRLGNRVAEMIVPLPVKLPGRGGAVALRAGDHRRPEGVTPSARRAGADRDQRLDGAQSPGPSGASGIQDPPVQPDRHERPRPADPALLARVR